MSTRTLMEDVYPLSPLQEGMLFHALDDGGGGLYLGQFGFRMDAALDEDAFERAWQAVVDRHPALRSGFTWENVDAPLQVVRREARLPLRREDWRGRTEDEQRRSLREYLRDDRARGFDLRRAPLMRLALFRTGDAAYQFVWTHHHAVLDGWSLGLVYRDVLAAYEAAAAGGEPALAPAPRYRDFIGWLKRQDVDRAEAYWRETLAGFDAPTPLGCGRADAAGAGETARLHLVLAEDAAAGMEALARRARATPSTVLQGAWALVLARYGGEDDVVFGAVVSGRPAELPGAAETVGLFANTLPLRVRVRGEETVLDWIADLQRQQAQLRAHEHTPQARVQAWSEVPHGVPLFESILAFQNFSVDRGGAVRDRFGVREAWGVEAGEHPLFVVASPGADGFSLGLEYHRGRFTEEEAGRMLEHLRAALEGLAAEPERRLRDVSLLSRGERRRLEEWQGARREYPREGLVHEVIAARAAARPEAVAVVHGERTLAYGELDAAAGRLARALRARGVGPEVRTAIFLERGPELAVSLLAVLRAGGAFVPVDPEYPAERVAYLVADSGAALVLTTAALAGRLPAGGAPVLCVDAPAEEEEAAAPAALLPDNAAYAIYTSGSTGAPKAAVVSHRSLLCYAEAMREELGLTPADRILQFASPSFDVMVEEVFPAWLAGAAVVFPEFDLLGAPAELLEAVAARGVTGFELPTAYWHEWVRTLAEEGRRLPECVRFVIVGGERVLPERLRDWAALGVPLVHVFGLTETSVTSTTLRLAAGEDGSRHPNLPVGRPLPNVEIHVLDREMEPVPVGVPGELYVGGDGLARGYLGRPALTAERFVPHRRAARAGARLYRTGDRVRWLEGGVLEFLGRIDAQVKVRGFRIEPAEIEAALVAHEAVGEAAVVVRAGASGEGRLVAYVAAPRPVSGAELREHLERRVPAHMVPSAFVVLDALPLTPNGKLDRRRLPDPGEARPDAERGYRAPRTTAETELARIWSEVLGVERVGVHDNFFELGGDSILSIQIVTRAQRPGPRLRPAPRPPRAPATRGPPPAAKRP